MRSHSYINSASNILQQYTGAMPFAAWLKGFFAANKKYGSKDRKIISHLCYSYFRLGHALSSLQKEERLLTALFLTSYKEHIVLKELREEWNDKVELSIAEKLKYLKIENELVNIFPWKEELSNDIDHVLFSRSQLEQPLLFLRIRPGNEVTVKNMLELANIHFEVLDENCIALNNATKIDDIFNIDKEVVIQDVSSQKTLEHFFKNVENKKLSAWDCCAASGGKSLLLLDNLKNIELTVSDIRESILINLKKRFERAGVKTYRSFIGDVAAQNFINKNKYDVIICDAPCSGSGTWSRTPEQLYFFNKNKIEHYSNLQKNILINAAKSLKQNGYFIYITCSVFEKENGEVVQFIQQNTQLKLLHKEYVIGYDKRADTLFTALFTL